MHACMWVHASEREALGLVAGGSFGAAFGLLPALITFGALAVSVKWGPLKGNYRAHLKESGVDIRQGSCFKGLGVPVGLI